MSRWARLWNSTAGKYFRRAATTSGAATIAGEDASGLPEALRSSSQALHAFAHGEDASGDPEALRSSSKALHVIQDFPSEKVAYVYYAALDIDQAANTSLAVIPSTEQYRSLSVYQNTTGGSTGKTKIRFDMSEDQSGEYTNDIGLTNANDGNNLTELGAANTAYHPNLFGSAIQILVDTQGPGETAEVFIMLRG